ncbi:hypothetical protein SJ05684_c08630 [Sinorhizobium sojae CCBAU 05684]|uniref:Transmembrane protein n=1 Tax=Sinorhizobium sojae CCBAU 05684 TaxID=716928 RepID=A0A249P8Y3_9HYPH|nr:hypothetical protein [Sinorhizobium sojae]ASY62326.1 hypothetical protein SJ05684_c08630 [Sinorhizobium sojae CCBAU 05684]
MNRIARATVIGALSALTFGGIAQAASVEMNWPKQIEQTVRGFKGNKLRIVNVDTLSRQDQTRSWIDEATPQQRAALHSAVQSNKPLVAKLKAHDVELNNIAGAEQAADGGLTIYLR